MLTSEPEQDKNNQVVLQPAEPEDIEALSQSLAEEKAKAEKYLANWQRAQADFINYKRHSEQEKEEIKKFANATFMLELLPLLDDLESVFAATPPQPTEPGWVDGIKLVGRKLQTILERQGLSPIKAIGEPFDPKFHEAVSLGNGKDGVVVAEVQKGYLYRDKVIRPAKVVVGNGEEE